MVECLSLLDELQGALESLQAIKDTAGVSFIRIEGIGSLSNIRLIALRVRLPWQYLHRMQYDSFCDTTIP